MTVHLTTRYHGIITVDSADELSCPVRGLADQWYLLSTHPHWPWMVLQAAHYPGLALAVCDPTIFWPAYGVQDPVPVAADDPTERAVLVVVTAGAVPTANLKAPLCIDRRTRTGMQVILNGPYAMDEPVPLVRHPSIRSKPHVVSHA